MDATKVHHNAGHGWALDRTGVIICNSLFYRNGGSGVNQDSNSGLAQVRNCTFYGNTGDGWTIFDNSGRNPVTMINNTFVANGGYGLRSQNTNRNPVMVSHNHHYLNTSGSTDVTDALGVDLITGDPLFTSTTDGSEDFAPTASSPLIDAGPIGMTIGAIPLVAGGGGGGTYQGGTPGTGGSGGGGAGGPPNANASGTAGTANTGGGAGGSSTADNGTPVAGAAGGSGIVIIRYKFQ